MGLEGLSIAAVAEAAGKSKGGVSAHFKSKRELQLATIEMALRIFQREVLTPAFEDAPGATRLESLCRHDLDYIRRRVFPGGCFFSAAAAEYCGREGAVKDRIALASREWMQLLVQTIDEARSLGEFAAVTDTELLAFEVNGMIVSANFEYNLHDDVSALERAEHAIGRAIDRARQTA